MCSVAFAWSKIARLLSSCLLNLGNYYNRNLNCTVCLSPLSTLDCSHYCIIIQYLKVVLRPNNWNIFRLAIQHPYIHHSKPEYCSIFQILCSVNFGRCLLPVEFSGIFYSQTSHLLISKVKLYCLKICAYANMVLYQKLFNQTLVVHHNVI